MKLFVFTQTSLGSDEIAFTILKFAFAKIKFAKANMVSGGILKKGWKIVVFLSSP